jgi:hypothetical protein
MTAALGLALVAGSLFGRSQLFVRGYFIPVLAVTGIGLVLVAWLRPPRLSRLAVLTLGLPLVAGLAMGPSQAAHVNQGILSGGLGARLGDGANPLLSGGGGPVSVLQVALAEEQIGASALVGRQVSLEAQVAGAHLVERLVMVCCAADARPVTLATSGSRLPPNGSWVRASGTLSVGRGVIVFDIDRLARVATPANPIL